MESRKVGLPFFSRTFQVGKARCLRDKPYRTTYAMTIRYGRTGEILPFVKADSLFFTDIDIIIFPFAFQEDDRRVSLNHFSFLVQQFQYFTIFRRSQNQAVFLYFQLLQLYTELVALLDQGFSVMSLVGYSLALFFNLWQYHGVRITRIHGSTQ